VSCLANRLPIEVGRSRVHLFGDSPCHPDLWLVNVTLLMVLMPSEMAVVAQLLEPRVRCRPTLDMSGGFRQAKLAGNRLLDGGASCR